MADVEKRLRAAKTWVESIESAKRERKSDAVRSALQGLVAQTRRAHISSLLLYADDAASANDWELVRDLAKRVTEVDTKCAHGYYLIGRADLAARSFTKSKQAFGKAASVESDSQKRAEYMDWADKADAKEAKAANPPVEDGDDGIPSVDVSSGGAPVVTEPAPAPEPEKEEAPYMPPPPPTGPRMEWYQSPKTVTVDIYAKGTDKEASVVNITERRLEVKIVRPGQPDYELERDLFGAVDAENSSWSATKYKFEIVLKKAVGGDWKALSSSLETTELSATEKARIAGEQKVKAAMSSQKNWEDIADKELENDPEKPDDGPMALFRTLYKDADEDTQRAMMKSYQESGGKVLSTDWKDVGSRKVEYKGSDD